jgi:hypothetical protein
VAYATPDILASLQTLFPEPSEVTQTDLLDYYDPIAPPQIDSLPTQVTLTTLKRCIATALPLSFSNKDGWRVDHLVPLVADEDCGEALASFLTSIIKGHVSNKIADLLSSATLAIILKKDTETMAAMKSKLVAAYVHPRRPLGMGSTLVKITSSYALLLLRGSLRAVVGPTRFSVETKGGCDLIQ